MKLLFICGCYPSSISMGGIFIHNQAKALKNCGIEIAVLEIDMRSIRRLRPWGLVKDSFDGVDVYRMSVPCGPLPFLLDVLSPLAGKFAFKRLIRDFGIPHILHTHFSDTSLPAVAISKKYVIPMILTEHSSGLLQQPRVREEKLFLASVESAKVTIAVGTALKEVLIALSPKDIRVIPNILLPVFTFRGIEKNSLFTFISVGHLIFRKRFDITLSAFAKLKGSFPEIQLQIVGTGELEASLKTLAKNLGIEESVYFTGQVDNRKLPEIYGKCHCFVLPSMFETFGVVYAEAAACGLPIIATKCGGPEDIITETNGILVEKDSVDEVYNAMKYIYQHYSDYSPVSISNDAIDRFGEDTVARQLLEVYKTL